MSEIKSQLASSLGKRDEQANIDLAKSIAKTEEADAVKELVELLSDKNKKIQSDAIKVLYEIAEHKPNLVAPHFDKLLSLLSSKNARLVWGSMTAIDAITDVVPAQIFDNLPAILAAVDNSGSVIARDHAVGALVKLASVKDYVIESKSLLIEQLHVSPVNQLPMYAEMILPIVNQSSKDNFIKALTDRLPDIEKESKRKRVERVIKRIKN